MNDTTAGAAVDSNAADAVAVPPAAHRPYRGRLFRKYLALILTLVTIALLASGGVSLYFTYQETKSALAGLQHEKALAAAARIEQYIRQIEQQIRYAALPQLDASDVDARRIEFLKVLRQAPEITDIAEVDGTGHEQIAVSRLGMDSLKSNKDRSAEPAFRDAKRGQPFFSPVYFRKETEPYMTIAVRSGGDKGPVTIADVNLKFVWDVVSRIKIGESGKAYVVDSNGFLVADPDIGLVLRKTNLSDLPHVKAARDARGGELAMVSRDIAGTEVLTSLAPIESLNWNVFVEQPVSEVYQKLDAAILRTALLLVAGLALSALGAWALARGMARPIRVLEDGAQKIGAGDLDQKIDIRTHDELEALADGFNRMSARLKESYAGLERKVEERTQALQNALEQQTAISEILRVISSSPTDVTPVLQAVAERAAHLCNAPYARVTIVDGAVLRPAAQYPVELAARTDPVPLDRTSITGRAAVDRATVHFADVLPVAETEFPGAVGNIRRLGCRAVLAVPLIREGAAYGGIFLFRGEPGLFAPDQVALVETFAQQAAIAIDNVRLFNQTKEALEQQTAISEILRVISSSPTDVRPMLNAVAERALSLCEAAEAGIFLVDGEQLRFTVGVGSMLIPDENASYPLTRNLVIGRAVIEGTTFHHPDIVPLLDTEYPDARPNQEKYGFRALLAVPLMRERRAIGAIALWRTEPRPFTDKQIALINTFADQAAIAIENVRLFNETKRALEQQTAISEILRVISSSPTDVQPVLDAVAQRAAQLCGAPFARALLIDGDLMRPASDYSLEGEPLAPPPQPIPFKRTVVTGRAALDRVTLHHADIVPLLETEYPDSRSSILSLGARGVLAVPLMREGGAYGGIFLFRREPKLFTPDQVALVETFARQAAIAIDNVRLFNETKRALEQQTAISEILRVISSSPTDVQPVLDAVAERAANLCQTPFARVLLVDGDVLRPAADYSVEKGPGVQEPATAIPLRRTTITGRAVLERKTIHHADVVPLIDSDYPDAAHHIRPMGSRAVLAVPLMRESGAYGGIFIYRHEPRPFTPEQIALVETFARQAAIAIDNVRLFNETKEALEQQTAISEILRVISSSPTDVQPVFDIIGERAEKLCNAEVSVVSLVVGNMVEVASVHGAYTAGVEAIGTAFPMPIDSETVTARTIRTRSVQHVADVLDDPIYVHKEIAKLSGFRAALGVPMLREEEVIGAIFVGRRNPGRFSDSQVALLKTFADQAAIAIQNVRLFNETKEALEQQTAVAEILGVISSSPTDVQPVLDAIAERAARLCDASSASMYLTEGDQLRHLASKGPAEAVSNLRAFPINRESISGRAIIERTTMHIADMLAVADEYPLSADIATRYGHRTVVVMPLFREGQPFGTIVLRRLDVRPFSEREIALLRTFGDQAAIALENVRLFNETKEALEQQRAAGEVLTAISSSIADTSPVFETILSSCERLFAGRMAVIDLVGDDGLVHLGAYHGPHQEEVRRVYPHTVDRTSATGNAIATRAVVHYPDFDDAPQFAQRAFVAFGIKAAIGAPMMWEGKGIGAIWVARDYSGAFSDKDIALLKTFAEQAVIAIQNARLFNETREALERQTGTAEVLRAISRTTFELQPILEMLIENSTRMCKAENGHVFLRDGGVYRLTASHGAPPDFIEWIKDHPVPVDEGSAAGRAALTRQPAHIVDARADPKYTWKEASERLGFRTILAVPMLREGDPIGVIAVWRDEVRPFAQRDIDLVSSFADQAVIAIENVRLFNETKEALEQQRASGEVLSAISSSIADTTPVFDKILDSCERLFSGTLVQINLVGDDGLVHLAGYHGPVRETIERIFPFPADEDSATGVAIKTRAVGHYPDIERSDSVPPIARKGWTAMGIKAAIVAPMLWESRGIGSVLVGRDYAGSFTEKEIALLKTFADQAVIAIQNARLFNETKEALEQQRASAEVLATISSSIADTAPVFDKILDSCERLFAGKVISINLLGDDGRVHRAAYHGPDEVKVNAITSRLAERETGTWLAIERRAVLHYADIENDADVPPGIRLGSAAAGVKSAIVAPMVWETKGIGAILVGREYAGPFSDKEIALLKTFADQAVIAIQNARLFNETNEALDQQRASAEILTTISSSIADTAPVFDKILESCERLFSGTLAQINLVGEDGLVRLGAYHGPNRANIETIFPLPVDNRSATGRALLSRAVVHFPDVEGGSDVPLTARTAWQTMGTRSAIGAPMLWEGKGIGVIFVGRATAGPFSDKEIALLKTFADQAVIAIQNARLFREIQDKSAQLEVANKHKSDFLANMSHELRTPLNAIIGFSEVMLERFFGDVNEKQEDYLRDIHSSGKHLLSLINDILDLSKVEAGRMELEASSFDVAAALSNALTLIRERAQRHGIALGQDVDPALGPIFADERKFKQILLNLLSNAVKFTPDGGQINVSARKEDSQAVIAVRDTGVGIAPEDQAAVFEEFRQVGHDYTRKQEGTGLGLALTRKFVELHGGKIWVDSEPGRGSTFTFTIPLHPDKVALH